MTGKTTQNRLLFLPPFSVKIGESHHSLRPDTLQRAATTDENQMKWKWKLFFSIFSPKIGVSGISPFVALRYASMRFVIVNRF